MRIATTSFAVTCLAALSASGCVIADNHVSTELHKICTDAVPLPYLEESPGLYVAELDIEGVGRTVEADAFASLATLEIDPVGGVENLAFAESISIDLLAPDSPGLPDVRVAALPAPGAAIPVEGMGDPSVNLVDYLTSEAPLIMRIEIRGQADTSAFVASLQACLKTEGLRVED